MTYTDNLLMANDKRYNWVSRFLSEKKGVLKGNEAMELLASVALKHNLWSAVYNLKTGELDLAILKRYGKARKFTLKDWQSQADWALLK